MRLFIFTFLFLLTSGLNASGNSTFAEGGNGDYNVVITQEDGACGSDLCITVTKMSKSKKIPYTKTYPFLDECYFTLNGKKTKIYSDYDGMVCRAKGRTPLAGATYKKIRFGASSNSCAEEDELGNKYVCVKGCGGGWQKPPSKVPEVLYGDDGLC